MQNSKRTTPTLPMAELLPLKNECRECSNESCPLASQSKMSNSSLLRKTFGRITGPRSRLSAMSSIETALSLIENSLPSIESVDTASSGQPQPDVMTFLISLCPEDVLPKILAFAGPQKTAALHKVNRVWRNAIAEERTWRVLCEDLYKWTPAQATPVSWKDFYKENPVVPTDYPSIHEALTAVSNGSKNKLRQDRKVRILVRPGRYDVPHAVTVHATRRAVQVTVQGINLPESFTANNQASLELSDRKIKRVTLVSKTRLRNEPLFRVIRGKLVLKNLNLDHMAMGSAIWSGNSAILVRGPNTGEPILRLTRSLPKATAFLKSVEVVSHSGRGVVALDAGYVRIKDSYIHDCAATGVFVGGYGSRVVLETVDVTDNGIGNERMGYIGGNITQENSGICIEQGVVSLTDCNVSRNLASGVYIVSPDLAQLTLEKTDLTSNFGRPILLKEGNMDQVVIGRDCKLASFGSGYWSNPRSSILVAKREDDELEAQADDL